MGIVLVTLIGDVNKYLPSQKSLVKLSVSEHSKQKLRRKFLFKHFLELPFPSLIRYRRQILRLISSKFKRIV